MTGREAGFFLHGLWYGLHLDQDRLNEGSDGWHDLFGRVAHAIRASGLARDDTGVGAEVRDALRRGGFRGEYYRASHPCIHCQCQRCFISREAEEDGTYMCSCGHSMDEHDPAS
jgi:hypothetical protein